MKISRQIKIEEEKVKFSERMKVIWTEQKLKVWNEVRSSKSDIYLEILYLNETYLMEEEGLVKFRW